MNNKYMEKLKNKNIWITLFVYAGITFGCLAFVTWIARMSFDNICVELNEEYIATRVCEEVDTIENAISFGKELDNYYGIDVILEDICNISAGNLEVVIVDADGNPLYDSMGDTAEGRNIISEIYDFDYQKDISLVAMQQDKGEKLELGDRESLVFPIYYQDIELVGHVIVVYGKNSLGAQGGDSNIGFLVLVGAVVVLLLIVIKIFVETLSNCDKWYMKYSVVILIMGAMMIYILKMYGTYEEEYTRVVWENASMTAEYIQTSVQGLYDKGLRLEQLDEVSDYLNNMLSDNQVIDNISVVKGYYDSANYLPKDSDIIIRLPVGDGEAYALIIINNTFIREKTRNLFLTFGAVFIICLMITFELIRLAEIISVKRSAEPLDGVASQIRLMSFLSYTALYTSMPYAAVIMRNWNATLWGFNESVSASLPLTVELVCVLLTSIILPRFVSRYSLRRMVWLTYPVLILSNLACYCVSSPYRLVALRALCGVGFGLLKYSLNSYVAAGSKGQQDIQKNYGQLNGGLLCGITIGASIGAVFADSLGYQANYIFTAVICVLTLLVSQLFMPWREIDAKRSKARIDTESSNVSLGMVFRKKSVFCSILLGDIPLNIGLMYVVSFLPVYASAVGCGGVVTSYAYLVNGIAGVYVGVFLISLLKKLSAYLGSVLALALGAAGILVLVIGSNAGWILLSAAIMGVFDGYGTPTVTSFFTGLYDVRQMDKVGMLTVFNSVGSAVQIICPLLYNVIIQTDGKTTYLTVFGLCFAAVAVLFAVSLKKEASK